MKIQRDSKRFPIFENDKVKVWRTVVPSDKSLPLHRHNKNRVIIPMTDIKMTKLLDNSGKIDHVSWLHGLAYWIKEDEVGKLHGYLNESGEQAEVIVVELK